MRVCVIVDNVLTFDTRVLRQVRTLRAADHEVAVIALEDKEDHKEPDLAGATLLTVPSFGGFHIQGRVSGRGTASASGAVSRRDRRAASVRIVAARYLARLSHEMGPYRYGRRTYHLARLAVRMHPEVCHANNLASLPAALVCKFLFGSKVIYDAHELEGHRSALSPLALARARALERILIRRADRVVTVCNSIAAYLAGRYDIPPPAVVRNVASFPREKRDVRVGLSDGRQRTVLYVGLLAPRRGLEQLIDALPLTERTRAVFVGPDHGFSGVLQRRARDAGVLDRIEIRKPVAPEEISGLMVDADVGYCGTMDTPLSYRYSLPNKLFSYLSAGLPVVASDLPEVRALLAGSGAGALFDLRSSESLRDAIRAMLDGDRKVIRERAFELARANSWEREEQRLLDVYAELGVPRAKVRFHRWRRARLRRPAGA